MSGQVLLRVKYDLYEYYINHLTKPERDYVLSVLKAVFAKLIEDVRQKKEAGQTVKEEERKEFAVVVEYKPPESDVLRIYKKYEALQRELESKLLELEEIKESKRALELEKQKCVQELEQIKKKPDELARQVAELRKEIEGYQLVFSVLKYCLESGECDPVKLNDYLRSRLSRIQLQKPPEPTLSIVRRSPK